MKGKDSFVLNENEVISGAKIILILAVLVSFIWLLRDLFLNKDLLENHVILMSVLIVVGLLNRISARGDIKIGAGPGGLEIESTNTGKGDEF